jgi:hypothetical protein
MPFFPHPSRLRAVARATARAFAALALGLVASACIAAFAAGVTLVAMTGGA